jgi:deoxyribonuclease IV
MMRVREVLDSLDTGSKAQLKKLLPKGLKMPDVETEPYPSALLSAFPKEMSYSLLGIVAEEMLRLPADQIAIDSLLETTSAQPLVDEGDCLRKVRTSKTSTPFLLSLQETRRKLESVKRGDLQYDRVLSYDAFEGHPDAMTPTQVFEVKLTGLLKQSWTAFLFQVFAYAALELSVQDIYLVLPLQKTVWHYSISIKGWPNRNEYRDFLNQAAKKAQENSMQDVAVGALLREMYFIGFHASKQKSLVVTLQSLPDYRKPYQIFLGGPQNTHMRIEDGELAAASQIVQDLRLKVFVHSQYIINLCTSTDGSNWNTELLRKNLKYANTIGCKGVVVHVGKSTTQPLTEALENMKKNILKTLEDATEACPLLLETPAGQGTETLKDQKEFIDFVLGINDPRLRICLDTCHVFACGHKPLDYIKNIVAHPSLLKLVHYNDSAAPCGSCVDRHAFMGTGHIGMNGMREIAEMCDSHRLPMVIE